jgi:hypothetical protein
MMTADLDEAWEEFRGVLKHYDRAYSLLNPPCPAGRIQGFENKFGFKLPESLAAFLAIHNGQQPGGEGSQNGIFKSISGWNGYERHLFLGIEDIETAYAAFIQDEVLLAEFGQDEIPFTAAGTPSHFRELFCLNAASGAVSLIWTQYVDPFNPPEWQVQQFPRAESLARFIEKQVELYR